MRIVLICKLRKNGQFLRAEADNSSVLAGLALSGILEQKLLQGAGYPTHTTLRQEIQNAINTWDSATKRPVKVIRTDFEIIIAHASEIRPAEQNGEKR